MGDAAGEKARLPLAVTQTLFEPYREARDLVSLSERTWQEHLGLRA